jgi:hypothetical protein
MITATARSITLPRRMNCLKPFNISLPPLLFPGRAGGRR